MATYTDYFSLTKPDLAENADITVLNQNTTKIDLVMHQNRQISCDAYDAQRQEPYNTGDVVIYENVMYECQEDNVSGTWDPTKWTVTNLGEQVVKAKSMGGGSTVVANPSGTASIDLTKLGIDGVNYNIPSGGGGGGGGSSYTEDTLWSNSSGIESTGNGVLISLTGNISDYDVIVLNAGRDNGGGMRKADAFYLVSDLVIGSPYLRMLNQNDNVHTYFFYTSDSSITIASAYESYPWKLFSVKGLKFGGGSSEEVFPTTKTQIGTWIDDSPIYRIVTNPNTTWGDNNNYSYAFASIQNIKQLVRVQLIGYWSNAYFGRGVCMACPGAYIEYGTTDIKGYKSYQFGSDFVVEYAVIDFIENSSS